MSASVATQPEATRTVAPVATATAALGALGIVYGDLGTSPLYTLQTVISAAGGHLTPPLVLGILSLIFWTLVIIISVKYCILVMRADNHGEGGILALMSLITDMAGGRRRVLIAFGLFGAALIYGDGMITPAISVLSALEGVNVATPALQHYVVPAAVVILFALFGGQALGTARIARLFGPIMLLWFIIIGALGAAGVMRHPAVLAAVDPRYAIRFLAAHGWSSFIVLGGVFLAVTGGEALYADMGPSGRTPIRISWYCIVLPALLLSYAGQCALLLDKPQLDHNPFFAIVPGWALYAMVALATCATIIASQAIITGAFSLTRQAMQLGWFPGLNIRQTSDEEYGQIYVATVNWIMMVFTIGLTVGFGSSARLSGAYGTAVSTTMLLTTILLYVAMRQCWHWSRIQAGAVTVGFLIVDLAFFAANMLKIADGGWIPLLLAAAIFIVMTSWHRGVAAIRDSIAGEGMATDRFLRQIADERVPRLPGTAVFFSRSSLAVSPLMARHLRQFGALPANLVSLNVQFSKLPRLSRSERVDVQEIADGFWQVTVHFGFMELPNVSAALDCVHEKGCRIDLADAIYFGSRDEVVRGHGPKRLPGWQRLLFGFMFRNAVHTVDRFTLPGDRFVEIGRQIGL